MFKKTLLKTLDLLQYHIQIQRMKLKTKWWEINNKKKKKKKKFQKKQNKLKKFRLSKSVQIKWKS